MSVGTVAAGASSRRHPYSTIRKEPIAGFTIQRRVDTPFGENKYFSEAPLPTEIHLDLLQQFESDAERVFKGE